MSGQFIKSLCIGGSILVCLAAVFAVAKHNSYSTAPEEVVSDSVDPGIAFILKYSPSLTREQQLIILGSARNCSRAIGEHADLFLAIWATESGFDPDALGAAGELGISQTRPTYWWCSSMELRKSLECGCMVFVFYYLREKGNLFRALVGYNGSTEYARKVIRLIPEVGND